MSVDINSEQYEIEGLFDELSSIFNVLKADLLSISEYHKPNTPHEQFWRRSMIRSLFSNIEAFCFSLKQMALRIAIKNSIHLSEKEIINILEKEVKTDESGILYERKVINGTVENFKFSLKILHRVCGQTQIPIDYNSQEYTNFIDIKDVRDRITHPKSSIDLEICDIELQKIRSVQNWYFSLIEQSSKTVLQMIKEK